MKDVLHALTEDFFREHEAEISAQFSDYIIHGKPMSAHRILGLHVESAEEEAP